MLSVPLIESIWLIQMYANTNIVVLFCQLNEFNLLRFLTACCSIEIYYIMIYLVLQYCCATMFRLI